MSPPPASTGTERSRLPRRLVVAAAAGLATLALHGGMPPHAGTPATSLPGTWVEPQFPAATLLLSGLGLLLLLAWRRLGSPGRPALRATGRLCAGLALPLAAPALDAAAFRCTAPGLGVLGAALGLLAAGASLGRAVQVARADDALRARRLAVSLAAGLAVALLVPGWPGVSGDEPHYLVVAQSLRVDGDLDVADDYARRSARAWHPDPLSPHYRPGLREGSRYSMHGAGYAALLTPLLAAAAPLGAEGMLLAARAFQALLYAFYAAALFGLIRAVAGGRAAIAGTLAATLTAPLLFAPLHLFPETAAMLLGCVAFAAGRGPTSVRRLLVVGIAAAALPWLGVKYLPMATVLVAMALWRGREVAPLPRLAAVMAPVAAGWLAHGLFTWALYGSLSPSAIYLGSDPDWTRQPGYGADWVAYVADWRGWGSTLVGYLLDQKEGLLPVAPHWLLAAAGLPWLVRRRAADTVWLLLITAAHVGPYALSQQLGGQSPPVRPLMAILWAPAVALGVALALPAGRLLATGRGWLLGAGATLTAYLAANPELLPHDYPVDQSWLLRDVVPRGTELWRWAPSWVSFGEPTWLATGIGTLTALALASMLAWLGYRAAASVPAAAGDRGALRGRGHGRELHGRDGRRGAAAAVALLGSALLLAHAAVTVSDRHVGARMLPGVSAWVAASLPERAWAEPGGVWVRPGGWREIVLTSTERLPGLRLHVRTLVATEVRLEWRGRAWRGRIEPGRPQVLEWPDPGPGYPSVEGRAWRLLVRADEGASPAEVEGGTDRRQLGAYLRLEPMSPP